MTPGRLYVLTVRGHLLFRDETAVVLYTGEKAGPPGSRDHTLCFDLLATSNRPDPSNGFSMLEVNIEDSRVVFDEIAPSDLVCYVHLRGKTPLFDKILRGGA